MDAMLEFARGPLFRLTFAILVLGLLRLVVLTIWNIVQAWYQAGDRQLPIRDIIVQTMRWLLPFGTLFRTRPVFSLISIIFHIGLLLVPIFLFAHVELWKSVLGFGWPVLPKGPADVMTVVTVVGAVLLFIGRIKTSESRFLSRKQDVLWPPVLALPFITGFACAVLPLSPGMYQWSMLIHILSAELIFLLIPFTKIAHCILLPFSQLISVLGWKFPADSGEKVAIALGKKGTPI